MARGQPTVTVSGESMVAAIHAWCDRRLFGRSRILGIAFMVYARLDRDSHDKAIEAHHRWQDAGCPLDWLDGDSDELPRFSLRQDDGPASAADAADADVSAATDAVDDKRAPRRNRRSS